MTSAAPGSTPILLRRIGVVARRSYEGLGPALDRVRLFASSTGAEVWYEESTLAHAPEGSEPLDLDREPVDVVLALGGDGTLLRASRLTVGRDIPVLGINVGHLGFLTAAGENELEPALERLATGDFELDRRFTLEATVVSADGTAVDGGFYALNDFVIHKGGVARVTRLDLSVGYGQREEEIGSFSADGVIFSTPTGSTAYSMSAGGPIVIPTVECITITAICPHTLAVRPLVVSTETRIRVRALDRPEDLVLTVDGQDATHLGPGDSVVVEKGSRGILLVRFPGQTFFSTLRRKLKWAIRPEEGV